VEEQRGPGDGAVQQPKDGDEVTSARNTRQDDHKDHEMSDSGQRDLAAVGSNTTAQASSRSSTAGQPVGRVAAGPQEGREVPGVAKEVAGQDREQCTAHEGRWVRTHHGHA
jgi:hypothetical protein